MGGPLGALMHTHAAKVRTELMRVFYQYCTSESPGPGRWIPVSKIPHPHTIDSEHIKWQRGECIMHRHTRPHTHTHAAPHTLALEMHISVPYQRCDLRVRCTFHFRIEIFFALRTVLRSLFHTLVPLGRPSPAERKWNQSKDSSKAQSPGKMRGESIRRPLVPSRRDSGIGVVDEENGERKSFRIDGEFFGFGRRARMLMHRHRVQMHSERVEVCQMRTNRNNAATQPHTRPHARTLARTRAHRGHT